METSSSLADALLVIAEAFLAGKVASADNPDVYQVIVHVGADVLTLRPPIAPGGSPASDAPTTHQAGSPPLVCDVSAETPGPVQRGPGHPADPHRCHVEDGPAISVTTAQMTACSSAMSWTLHDLDGAVLDVGRRRDQREQSRTSENSRTSRRSPSRSSPGPGS